MRTQAVIQFFGSQIAAAEKLGITQPSVAEWGEFPPDLRQLQIEAITGGQLKAEPSCYGPQRPKEKPPRKPTPSEGASSAKAERKAATA